MGSDPIFLLAIDAGNTRIKWGVHDGRAWVARGAIATPDADALSRAWNEVPRETRAAIAANVAGAEVEARLARACAERNIALEVAASRGAQLGVTNGYRDPGRLGADRWVALVAAHRQHPGNKLVVNAGTALTIDALTAEGRFLGGLIVPGPALMRRSLDRGTANLRQTEGRFDAFPAATPDAITSGAIQACIGAIERMSAAMQVHGAAPDWLVLSGGAAGELAPYLSLPTVTNENLVLDGLALIARAAEHR